MTSTLAFRKTLTPKMSRLVPSPNDVQAHPNDYNEQPAKPSAHTNNAADEDDGESQNGDENEEGGGEDLVGDYDDDEEDEEEEVQQMVCDPNQMLILKGSSLIRTIESPDKTSTRWRLQLHRRRGWCR